MEAKLGKLAWCGAFAVALLLMLPGNSWAALSWSAPTSINELNSPGMAAVACPSPNECVAVEGPPYPQTARADEVTYNPGSPSDWMAYTIDRGNSPTAIACPSTARCVAVGSGGFEATFDPRSPEGATANTIDPGHTLRAVACPSISQCTAVDGSGAEVTFDPGSRPAPHRAQIETSAVSALACSSTSQCTAVDGLGGAVTFDPTTGAKTASASLGDIYFSGIACPSTGGCVATGVFNCVSGSCLYSEVGNGREVTFNPSDGDAVTATASSTFQLYGVACSSNVQCTAMDQSGQELTFDPATPASVTQGGVDGSLTTGAKPTSIACPSDSRCTIVDLISGVEVSFNPQSPGDPRPVAIGTGAANRGVACPSAGVCAAIAVARQSGKTGANGVVAIFDPRAGRERAAIAIVAGTPTAVTCASRGQCTVVNSEGGVATFDPGRPPARITMHRIDGAGLTAIACPSATQCTAVDGRGNEVTFDPHRAGSALHRIDASGLTGIACPSAKQCAAVDDSGHEVSFVPGKASGSTEAKIDGNALTGVSCPSTSQCTAVDDRGRAATFKPGALAKVSPARVDRSALTGVSCPTTSLCVAGDAAGQIARGAPGKRWAVKPLPGADVPLVVACSSRSQCVALDDDGHLFVGRG